MNTKFIDSVNRRLKSLKKKNPRYYKTDFEQSVSHISFSFDLKDATDFQLSFISLYVDNKKLETLISKQLNLLSNQEFYRQDISQGVVTMKREMRPPEDQESKWQLLYETTLWATNESGPIMHLFFDGWDLINCKIYYWDETAFYDISEEEELIAAKNKIAAFGIQLDKEIGDEGILKVKKNLGDYFPNYDTNIHGRKFNLDSNSNE